MALTAAVTLKDASGATVFTKSSLAVSSTNRYDIDANNHPLRLALAGAHTIEGAISGGNPTTATTISVYLIIED